MAEGLAALRLCSPVAVASAESVMEFEPMAWIVVPEGMPVPATIVADRQFSDIDNARDGR